MKRQYFIDNLRWMWIVLLIPFHTAMAWNTWEGNYIYFEPNNLLSSFIIIVYPFYMPSLFVLAGISMNFSLRKRSAGTFVAERIKKLFIPLLSGIATVCAYMAYIADKFNNGYELGFVGHYGKFFTTMTNLTGYDGCFTPAHLWFLLFLFISSLFLLLVVKLQQRFLPTLSFKSIRMWMLFLLCVFPIASSYILNFGGKSVGESFAFVALGYYVFSEESIVSKLEKNKYILLAFTFVASCVYAYVFVWLGIHDSLLCRVSSELSKWCGVLGFLGLGKCFMNKENLITRYMRTRSFLFYIFHFMWVVFMQYALSFTGISITISYIVTVIGALLITLLCIELVSRIPGIRFLFGYKHS